ncbi:hypothetical protein [Evansella tamaricis]|uniref:Uncharacterized protein n=1 Tax=Evansella tamaricis TaxID=2069301 RepID=A0ABS6JF43_9BACI|nr:hypothetical protein [Evansella tamaricis]MBU9711080.1 hypothetical protein [Evansella tamaricis]
MKKNSATKEGIDLKEIYRTYNDTEVSEIVVNVECPYCGEEWQEDNPECGVTYELTCTNYYDTLEEGCGKKFKMYFDAS